MSERLSKRCDRGARSHDSLIDIELYVFSQNNYENNWLLKLKENKFRHYGHRREIETLSSPLGRHFGEFTFLFCFFFIFIFKLQMSSQGATISGEGCGYDNWQLQIIDRVEEGQPGQLGKRWHSFHFLYGLYMLSLF